jgi:NhaP-type Na+/H+ or K+/H+ antiporter
MLATSAYLIPEILKFSGAISMMITGIFLAHFNFYNMSEYGVKSSKDSFEAISVVIEGVLFIYLGFSFWTFNTDAGDHNIKAVYSWTLLLFLFAYIVFLRMLSIIVVTLLFKLCMRKKWNF